MTYPTPITDNKNYKGSGKLTEKVVVITGGDSGIGKAAALAFAKEGAKLSIVYLGDHEDAVQTKMEIEDYGSECLLIEGDVSKESFCQDSIRLTINTYGKLDILVNNAGVQFPQKNLLDVTAENIERTFKVNVFGYIFMAKAALPYLQEGANIINTSSVTCYLGHEELLDYSATKGAIVAFTRSLSLSLAPKKIRVNAVAPGPIWSPLTLSTMSEEGLAKFGAITPMKRPAHPYELAPAYVYLACEDSSYVSGQVLHVNGGRIVNG